MGRTGDKHLVVYIMTLHWNSSVKCCEIYKNRIDGISVILIERLSNSSQMFYISVKPA